MFSNFDIQTFVMGIITGILSSFCVYLIISLLLRLFGVAISNRIVRSVNTSFYNEKVVAWKFKVVNKFPFMSIQITEVKLVGIKYVLSSEGIRSEHRKELKCIAGVAELTKYLSKKALEKKIEKDADYVPDFFYRPLTFDNLDELSRQYSEYELSVRYIDSLSGRNQVKRQRIKSDCIVEGDFLMDGSVNQFEQKPIPAVAWENYRKQKEKENLHKNESSGS